MRNAFLLTITFLCTVIAYPQISGMKTIPGTYPTIAAAVAALNAQGVGAGGVTFNVAAGYTETSPDSIYLAATGTALNRIVFQKSGAGVNPRITRTGAGLLATSTPGGAGDAVFILESSDYVTIEAIDLAAADAGIEYGFYLRKSSGIDGCKNDTIRNCSINMTKGASQYVTGIYSSNNLKNQSPASATGVTVTSVSGRNENVTFTGNIISNVSTGIYIRGYGASTPYDLYDQNFVVGALGAGNIIQNFAGNTSSTAYGIYLINQNGARVNYNDVNNTANGGIPAADNLYGIFHSTGINSSVAINNNIINISVSAATAALTAIYNNGASGTVTINNNVLTLNSAASGSGGYYYINNNPGTLISAEINNNTFIGTNLNASVVYLIFNQNIATGTSNISGNFLSGTLQTTGSVNGYINVSSSTGTENIFSNNFSNIILSGLILNGIIFSTAATSTQNVYNNTISNITGTNIGSTYIIHAYSANTRNVYGNKIFSISTAGDLFALTIGDGTANCNVYNNQVSDLATTGTTFQQIRGVFVNTGAINLYNNIIGDFRVPAASSSSESIIGIALGFDALYSSNVYYNSVYLNASSTGTDFSTTAFYYQNQSASATGSLNLKNNIIVNTSVARGSGLTVAFKRLTASLINYSTTSNNNLFYAGTPGAKNLIHYDGTNSDQTLTQYKARVSPRDVNSVTENPPFLSTAGNSPAFLHINPAASTQVSNTGIPISGYTNDFDGDLRNTITPDIGADEFQAALPVTLGGLKGERRDAVNKLSWTTLAEANNTGFELQRSANGITFSSIGFVASKAISGNSNSALHYSFDDVKATNGTNYYRLKQVDKDGWFTYSNIVSIGGLKLTKMELLNVYPNPAVTSLNMDITVPATDKITLLITDIAGKVVMQKVTDLLSGENHLSINVAKLAKGSYSVKIVSGTGNNDVRKFVKQ